MNCPICDRPAATSTDDMLSNADERDHLCWSEWGGDPSCRALAIDWRARALAAGAAIEALTRRVAELMQRSAP